MPSSLNRAVRPAMIPWIIGLFVLFGISAIAPVHSIGEKYGASKETSVSQAVDHGQFPGNSTAPLLKLLSLTWSYSGLDAPAASLLRVDHSKERWVRTPAGGVPQGRAPPVCLLALA